MKSTKPEQKKRLRQSLALVTAGFTAISCGAGYDEPLEELDLAAAGQALFADSNQLFMPTGNSSMTLITLCWTDSTRLKATERGWVEDVIDQTWDEHSWVDFTWKRSWEANGCGTGYIPINHHNNTPNGAPSGVNLNLGQAGAFVGWGCPDFRACIETSSVHEFGHLLAFDHEHNRDANGVICPDGTHVPPDQGVFTVDGDLPIGPEDPDSAVDYCSPDWPLSPGDIEGVRAVYGGSGKGVKHNYRVLIRESDGKYWETATRGFQLVDSYAGTSTKFTVTRVGASSGTIAYGDKINIRNGLSFLCARRGSASSNGATPGYLHWRANDQSGDCDWEVRRSASGWGGSLVDVNDPFKLYIKVEPREAGEQRYEHLTRRLRMLHAL